MTTVTETSPLREAPAVAADLARRIGVRVLRDQALDRHTTMRVGGPADLLVTVRNAFELRAVVRYARTRAIPHVVLGRGSDVVVADRGIRGLVIICRAEGSRTEGETYHAEAGVPMARVATETAAAGLAGLEFGLAIPGTVGGAVWANAGAHDGDVAGVLGSATVLRADGREEVVDAASLGLGYRDSALKRAPDPDDVTPLGPADLVVSATFRLRATDPAAARAALDGIRAWRRAHQPLGIPSAGSVFRNPADGPAAGWLIERAGLKGRRIGGAAVSERHANFIVNDGHGRAADVRELALVVRDEVERRSGVRLAFEIVFLGAWDEPAAGVGP
jgi:UDP-N-acetylmuramate dehydrogenase